MNNVKLTDGNIRFILWALKNVDTSINEGMDVYSRMTDYQLMVKQLMSHLPESNKVRESAKELSVIVSAVKNVEKTARLIAKTDTDD